MGKCRTKRITFASGLSSDCSPCRRVVRGNACSGNTAAHTAPSPAAALRQCLIGTFLHRQRFSDVQCFCAPCRFPCFPVAAQWAQRKPPFDSVSMERSWGKSSQKLLLCVTVEACQVGDYGSYYRLTHTAPASAHTPAQPDYKRQPMRWKPLRKGIPCGTGDSCDARCGFAPPGTNAGTKARIRHLFSADYRNGSVSQECSPAVRGSRVYG